ncbi:hypothetical protein F3Y22_tig00116951pilonHSYRG00454 [Hibiscus syriacus]|uniref:TF-B3 domain-containing protein n=1 Tax=Hibiscus syriacus TaxID=106335 RepID=A0A6A2XES0_HIBSY|nr:hypothetical protein F3Y22_tig00116951pilonHSYRG00454 [Hibiscus syriacus]
MENVRQGRARFARRLTQMEMNRHIILFPFVAVAAYFNFEEGQLFPVDVIDSLGKKWAFLGTSHADEQFGNYVSFSWSQFSIEKGLKVNDEVVIIEMPQGDDEQPHSMFKIEIKRQIKLFGVNIWGELNV